MAWYDYFKLFTYAFKPDPASAAPKNLTGAGVTQPDAIPDIRLDNNNSAGRGIIPLRDTTEFVDLSTVTNRQSRYKEYDRLQNLSEIESVLTALADETCVTGDTLVSTPSHGLVHIRDLAKKFADKRFLVYCFDFKKLDFTLGWAHSPRLTGTRETVKIVFDDGSKLICTPDHKILKRDFTWELAGQLKRGDDLTPFYRLPARTDLNRTHKNQFPRIFTFSKSWMHERQFVDEWKLGMDQDGWERLIEFQKKNKNPSNIRELARKMNMKAPLVCYYLKKNGFSLNELNYLNQMKDYRKIVDVCPGKESLVYDLTVDEHHNFCTDKLVVHNCQKDEHGRCFRLETKNSFVKEELESLFFDRNRLNLDQKTLYGWVKNFLKYGDFFGEVIIDPQNPKFGVLRVSQLPTDSMYRIETTQGRLVEFQQSKEGPDYQSLSKIDVYSATDAELNQATAIRFRPEQILHVKNGDERKMFYPYGISIIEPARGPAHQLRLMEDCMVVYRLCLVGNTRVRTLDGWKYIKDIVNGDFVYSYDGQDLVKTLVKKTYKSGKQKVFKIITKYNDLTASELHPVLVFRDGYEQYVETKDLKTTDYLVTRKTDMTIPVTFNHKYTRLLGYLCGSHFAVKQLSTFIFQKYFNIMSKYAVTTVPQRIPSWVFLSPDQNKKAFIKGMADSCGFRMMDHCLFDISSRKMVEDIKELWTSLGLASSRIRKDDKSYVIKLFNKKLPQYLPIQKIKEDGVQETYDITVDSGLSNFVANGVIVHNSRAPERKVFYIDVGSLAPYRVEMFMDRIKDQFRKDKVPNNRSSIFGGPSQVEEKWRAPSAEEDYWVPIRPNQNTRIDTLQGSPTLNDVDDVLYFRNKLYAALNFPKNYFNNEDPNMAKVPLSMQNAPVAKMVERFQSYWEDGIFTIADRHLHLLGVPEEEYGDLKILFTPPSEYRELARAEVINNRINVANQLKGSVLMSDYDILVDVLKLSKEEAEIKLARLKLQKLEDLKFQVVSQNPILLGIGSPGDSQEGQENKDNLDPNQNLPSPEGNMEPSAEGQEGQPQQQEQKPQTVEVPDPEEDDIKKYNLELLDASKEMDEEDIDYSSI